MTNDSIAAAVLCGGSSRRTGYPKTDLIHPDGGTFLQHITRELDFFPQKYLSLNETQSYEAEGYQPVVDAFGKIGPIGGLCSVLEATECDAVLLAAVDMLFYDAEEARGIMNAYNGEDVFLAKTREGYQPVASIYRKSCLPTVKELIGKQDYRLLHIADEVSCSSVYESQRMHVYKNINTLEEYRFTLRFML